MAVKVRIPIPLQRLTGGQEVVEGGPGTVMELIAGLDRDFPGLAERVSEGGKIRRFVNIYVNEEDIRFLNAERTDVKDGDEVSIVPAIAGGAAFSIQAKPLFSILDTASLIKENFPFINPDWRSK